MRKRRIVFVMHALHSGGAERIVVSLANHIDRQKYEVHLILLHASGAFLQDLASDIVLHDLKINSATKGLIPLVRQLIRLEPDVIFGGIGYLNALLSVSIPWVNRRVKKPIKWVARETSIVSLIIKKERFTPVFEWLYRHSYRNFNQIICQSEYMKHDLKTNYALPDHKMVVIHNPVDTEKIDAMVLEPLAYRFDPHKINLLAVGAFRPVKQFDKLLEVLVALDNRFHLTLVGDGAERTALEAKSTALGIPDRVSFVGYQANPYAYMKQADLLLLSSEYEGFPNVVLEANYCGLPVIGFDAPGGIGEIVQEGVNGQLVALNDVVGMIEAIKRFSKADYDPKRLQKMILERYGMRRILTSYEAVIG